MNNSDSILVVIDPTVHEQHALNQASILAHKLGKKLVLLICTHDESLQHYKNILDEEKVKSSVTDLLDVLLESLETMAEPYRNKGLEVTCDVVWDRPVDEGIIRKAIKLKPFLIVKDTHYHPKLTRTIFRNTDWSLIRTCPFPLLLVKHNVPWHEPSIISAVNPINDNELDLDTQIVRFGQLFEAKMAAKHQVLHVCEPLTVSYVGVSTMGYAVTLHDQYEELLDMHKKCLLNLADEENIDHEKVIFKEGSVVTLLPEIVAERDTNLVIMGSTSKSRIAQVFIGGTAEAVLDEIDCDVLVLKPSTFVTPVSEQAPPEYPQIIWPM